jgi:hypothetical protein
VTTSERPCRNGSPCRSKSEVRRCCRFRPLQLHVRLDKGIDAYAYLSPFLASVGLRNVEKIRPIEPTLEDVFVALVGRKGTPVSLRRIKALVKKEFIQMSRDVQEPRMGALFIPLLMIFLFGYALSLDVDRIPRQSSSTGTKPPSHGTLFTDSPIRAISALSSTWGLKGASMKVWPVARP